MGWIPKKRQWAGPQVRPRKRKVIIILSIQFRYIHSYNKEAAAAKIKTKSAIDETKEEAAAIGGLVVASGGRVAQSVAIARVVKHKSGQISAHPHSRGVWPDKSQTVSEAATKPVSMMDALLEHKSSLLPVKMRLEKAVVLK